MEKFTIIALCLVIVATTVLNFAFYHDGITLIVNLIIAGILIGLSVYRLKLKPTTPADNKNTASTKFNTWFKQHYFGVISWTVTITAILTRTIAFSIVPAGLNADEASMLYDAYSLGHFGIDRNGASFPVYMEAWGHGQNALLTYLTIPFVLMFGMNVFTARIVSLIFGLISLFVFYDFVKLLTGNRQTALICYTLFALCPYTIMIARWGLESNLFPHFLLYGLTLLLKTHHKHSAYLLPACFILGISLYAYAISYLVVPLLLIGVYVYFFLHHTFTHRNLWIFICANFILFCLALPLILFLLVNQGWLNEIHWGAITITKMRSFRGGEISLKNIFLNLCLVPGIILGQNDCLLHNSIFTLGILYGVTMPFMVIGIVQTVRSFIKNRQFNSFILCLWLVVSLLTALLIKYPNINKINSVWFVLIIMTGLGLHTFVQNNQILLRTTALCLVILFTTFCGVYFTTYNQRNATNFNDGLIDSIHYAKNLTSTDQTIFFSQNIHEPYIYCLVADNKSPDEFLQTRIFATPSTVQSYGRYQFQQNITDIAAGQIYIIGLNEFQTKFQNNIPTNAYHLCQNFVVIYLN